MNKFIISVLIWNYISLFNEIKLLSRIKYQYYLDVLSYAID